MEPYVRLYPRGWLPDGSAVIAYWIGSRDGSSYSTGTMVIDLDGTVLWTSPEGIRPQIVSEDGTKVYCGPDGLNGINCYVDLRTFEVVPMQIARPPR